MRKSLRAALDALVKRAKETGKFVDAEAAHRRRLDIIDDLVRMRIRSSDFCDSEDPENDIGLEWRATHAELSSAICDRFGIDPQNDDSEEDRRIGTLVLEHLELYPKGACNP